MSILILIKGMDMPKCCDECWALDDYGDYPRCRITEEQRGYTFNTREKKMPKCPLVGISKHGRLIDADAFFEDICNDLNAMTKIGIVVDGDWLWAKLNDALEHAPTIIEGGAE